MSFGAWLKRLLALFLPGDEAQDAGPVEIFDEAIRGARQRFLDLRATASPLYQSRDALVEQVKARESETAQLGARAAELLRGGDEKQALEAAARQGRVQTDLERLRKELADLAKPIDAVEGRLRKIEGEVRDLERERERSAALLKSADARVAVDRILGAQASAELPDLGGARDAVTARLEHARALEQVSGDSTEAGLAALEDGLEEQGARARLEAIRAVAQLPPADGAKLPAGQGGEKDNGL